MMKDIFIGIAGLIVGAIGGYFIAEKVSEKKMTKQVEDMREYYINEYKSEYEAHMKNMSKPDLKPDDPEQDLGLEPNVEAYHNTEKELISKYDALKDDEIYISEKLEAEKAQVMKSGKSIEIITDEELENDFDEGWPSVTLTLYSDGILADNYDREYDISDTIGYSVTDALMEQKSGLMNIRNNRDSIDYVVMYSPDAFTDNEGR